jgi:hypothetical protein
LDGLTKGVTARETLADHESLALIAELHLITAKPMLYVANVAEDDLAPGAASPHLSALRDLAAKRNIPCLVICAKIEAELNDLPESDRREFLVTLGLRESGLSALARAVYALLGLETFFTFNEKELRAWTIPVGATAPKAAGVIHTDFEKGFVRADVYSVDDLDVYKTETALRGAGKIRSEGKEYRVKDGEILFFKFTA